MQGKRNIWLHNGEGDEQVSALYQSAHIISAPLPSGEDDIARQAFEISVEGPWGVYDVYCLQCSQRYISVAPIQTEAVDLWECAKGCGMTCTWHLREADDE